MRRTATKRRLLEGFRHVLAGEGVAVADTWNWQQPTNTALFLGTQDGDIQPQAIGGSHQLADDQWVVQGSLWVFGQKAPLEAEEETERLFLLAEAWLRASSNLRGVENGQPPVPAFDPDPQTGKAPWGADTRVRVSTITGPWHTSPPRTPPIGRLLFDLLCTSTVTT